MLRWPGYIWRPLTLTLDLDFSRSNCISGIGGPIVMEIRGWHSIECPGVKHLGNESTERWADSGTFTFTFDLEFWRSNCISGMGGPIVIERKGRDSIGCPDVKHSHYDTGRGQGGVSVDSFSFGIVIKTFYLNEFKNELGISNDGKRIANEVYKPVYQ